MTGLVIAGLGIFLGHHHGIPELDSVASALIGLLLVGVALLLIRESRGLLIGEGLRPEIAEANEALVSIKLDFAESTLVSEATSTINAFK